jgi:DNA-directed RNA polymerase subunit E'/Rpb7
MFNVVSLVDTIRIPAHNLRLPSLVALKNEIDLKFPNRVLTDVGLVISRYGDILKITNGCCVPGDGGSHHECLFRLVVFRPFVEEVCVGTIVKSTPEGIQVSLGFFQNIFIPAYWMLRPSSYDEKLGLWVWTPDYGDDDEEETGNNKKKRKSGKDGITSIKQEDSSIGAAIKTEDSDIGATTKEEEQGDRWEMDIGAEIRFKVKSIQFTTVTNTAKGVQATTTTTDYSHSVPKVEQEDKGSKPHLLRKRSTSVDLSDSHNVPAAMQIVASICEDGLGLTSWWASAEEDEDGENRVEQEQ